MENLINTINDFILQNQTGVIVGAIVLIFLAGAMFKQLKMLAIILLLAAIATLYLVIGKEKIQKIDIDDIKDKVKNKVIEKLDS